MAEGRAIQIADDRAADALRIVLDRPQDVANIGAVVRAIKNMGLRGLRLVAPRPFAAEDLARYAHHCEDVIARIEVFADLDAALADTVWVVGTAAHAHAGRALATDMPALMDACVARSQAGPVALVFGTEDDGLSRAALDRCHVIATLPVDPDYPALNLAQSVLLFAYELRQARLRQGASGARPEYAPETMDRPAPTQADLERLFGLAEAALTEIGFFRYNREGVLRSVRDLVYRAQPTREEAALLLAMAKQVRYVAGKARAQEPD